MPKIVDMISSHEKIFDISNPSTLTNGKKTFFLCGIRVDIKSKFLFYNYYFIFIKNEDCVLKSIFIKYFWRAL